MAEFLDTVLLLALPASGKSEVRTYMASVDPETCSRDFRMGPTVQLDDFPYVHMMRVVDDALGAAGAPAVFFEAPDRSFQDPRDWGTLIELVNEDYDDLMSRRAIDVADAGTWIMDRLDAARAKVGAEPALGELDDKLRARVSAEVGDEARRLFNDKIANYPETLDGRTVVIEFARGGPDGAAMPLAAPYGYAYSVAQLSEQILERAAILYVWVTPEESRRKNEARADPNDPGSILHHGVPAHVMRNEYGCDDMDNLIASAQEPDTIPIEAHGRSFNLPVARFDNRVDKTSFIREQRQDWAAQDVEAIHAGLSEALTRLYRTWSQHGRRR
jgi:hypothetical protein